MPFDAFIRSDVSYQSSVKFDFSNPALVQKAYAVVNASIGLDQKDRGGLQVTFFVNNVFNQRYASALGISSGGTTGLVAQTFSRNAQRYAGVRVRFGF